MTDLISDLPGAQVSGVAPGLAAGPAPKPVGAGPEGLTDPMLMCLAMAAKLLDRPVHLQVLRAGFALDARGRVPLEA